MTFGNTRLILLAVFLSAAHAMPIDAQAVFPPLPIFDTEAYCKRAAWSAKNVNDVVYSATITACGVLENNALQTLQQVWPRLPQEVREACHCGTAQPWPYMRSYDGLKDCVDDERSAFAGKPWASGQSFYLFKRGCKSWRPYDDFYACLRAREAFESEYEWFIAKMDGSSAAGEVAARGKSVCVR